MRTNVLAASRPSPTAIRLVPLQNALRSWVPHLFCLFSPFLFDLSFWPWFSLGKTRGNGVVVPQGHVIFHFLAQNSLDTHQP